ncbi:MAG: PAS domain-containing protein [Dongiaceae bacterium]
MPPHSTAIRIQDAVGRSTSPKIDAEAVLNAVAAPTIVVDRAGRVAYVNTAAEQFFHASATTLVNQPLAETIPSDSQATSLIDQARRSNASLSEYSVTLELPRIGVRHVTIGVSPVAELPGSVVVTFPVRSIADQIVRQLTHRGASRSVGAIDAQFAHEV